MVKELMGGRGGRSGNIKTCWSDRWIEIDRKIDRDIESKGKKYT